MKIKAKRIVAGAIVFIVLVVFLPMLFNFLHEIANEQRGHSGIGGEIAVWFLPVICYYFYKNAKDTKSVFEDGEKNESKTSYEQKRKR